MMAKNIKIYTDGGARGNPGPSAAGMLILDDDERVIALDAKYLGRTTNNQAEYQALILALKMLAKIPDVGKVKCYLDSELIVKQLSGEYKVKNAGIAVQKKKIDDLIEDYDIEFIHVVREKNEFADKLVNIVLDARDH